MLFHYLKTAFRNLKKYKFQYLTGILGLSVAITGFALCLYFVRYFSNMDNQYNNPERIYSILTIEGHNFPALPSLGAYLQQEFPEIEKQTVCEVLNPMLFSSEEEKKTYDLRFLEADTTWLDFFSWPLLEGSESAICHSPNSIVLSQSTAQKIFGKTSPIGKQLTLQLEKYNRENDKTFIKPVIYMVRGVMKDWLRNSILNIYENTTLDGLIVLDEEGRLRPDTQTGQRHPVSLVTLKQGIDPENFNRKIQNYQPQEVRGTESLWNRSKGYYLLPFSQTLNKQSDGMLSILLLLVSGIGFMILAVALFNYISFTVGLFLNRLKECAVRKTVCANSRQTYSLFFTEIVIAVLIAGLFGFLWVYLFLPHINPVLPSFLYLDSKILSVQLLQYILIGILLAALLSILPFHVIDRMSVRTALFGGSATGKKTGPRFFLLGIQLFVSILFITASFFLLRQLNYMEKNTLKGMSQEEKENTIEVKFYHQLLRPYGTEIYELLKERFKPEQLLLVQNELANTGETMTDFQWEGKVETADNSSRMLGIFNTDHNYPDFCHIPMVKGHFLTQGKPDEMVVNETAARLIGKDDIIGMQVRSWSGTYTITGIIKDERMFSSSRKIPPVFYVPVQNTGLIYVKTDPENKEQALKEINQIIRRYLPETIPYELTTLDKQIKAIYLVENMLSNLLLVLTFISIAISLLGVYSSVSLNTEQRRKEVAIRKINGARMTDILSLFFRKYLILLTIVSIPAFILVGWGVAHWLKMYVDHSPISLWVFVGIWIIAACLLVSAILYHVLRVARINPAEVVKKE